MEETLPAWGIAAGVVASAVALWMAIFFVLGRVGGGRALAAPGADEETQVPLLGTPRTHALLEAMRGRRD
ncbi:MAG TPA: hypothetical protein VIN04_10255 [Myxococcota bacterium]